MIVYVVKDMPEPNDPRYREALNELLVKIHLAQEGSVLTLFTNRREMENCFEAVQPRLKQAGLRHVCDAACGFGTYTLALASNGFSVESFDISETAVRLTRGNLKKLGYDVPVKVADITRTGYRDGCFDGVFAHSVLDHMTCADARAAMEELFRIVRSGGLVLLSFDTPEEADFSFEHELLPDGSLLYRGGSRRSGMIFHPYDADGIAKLLDGRKPVWEAVNGKGERIVILKK